MLVQSKQIMISIRIGHGTSCVIREVKGLLTCAIELDVMLLMDPNRNGHLHLSLELRLFRSNKRATAVKSDKAIQVNDSVCVHAHVFIFRKGL